MNWFGFLARYHKQLVFLSLILTLPFLPWWGTVLLTSLAALLIKKFYAAIAIGLILDAVFGLTPPPTWSLSLPFTLFFFLLVVMAAPLQARLSFNHYSD